ncbi:MAG: hypothetical protein PUA50_07955 [Eubacteriales bacterium]|nr:hypothetical protein [Eubacteriales bacterium]
MAIKNNLVKSAYDKTLNSKYSNVNAYRDTSFSGLDDWYDKAKDVSAYDEIEKAYGQQFEATKEGLALQGENAYDTYLSGRRTANAAYQPAANRNGSLNEKMTGQGLRGSGYEEIVKSGAFRQKQQQLSGLASELQKARAQLVAEYNTAVASNNEKIAQLRLSKINQITQTLSDLNTKIQNIQDRVYDMDYNERYFAYQKSQG